MRLGIDISCLQSENGPGAGLSRRLLGLLTGLIQLDQRPEVTLCMCLPTVSAETRVLEVLCNRNLNFPVRRFYRPPGQPHNMRMRLNGKRAVADRPDVLQVITDHGYRVHPGQLRAALIPDLGVIHAPDFYDDKCKSLWQELFQHAQNHADLVVTYSEHARSDIAKLLGISAQKVVVVSLAADLCYRQLPEDEVRAQLATRGLEYRRYLLTVGTIEPRKNHIGLFRAYVQYRQRAGKDALPLIVAGATGCQHDEIMDEPARLGIASSVRFLGRTDGLKYFYNGAAAFIYPSLFEGFGLPPLEAMACGTPVVASNATSLPEVVQGAGLMFHPVDSRTLAEHLMQITSDETFRSECAARGLAIASKFSWRNSAQRYVAALEKAVARQLPVSRELVPSLTPVMS